MFIFLLIMWFVDFISFKQLIVLYFFMFLSWIWRNYTECHEIHIEFNGNGGDDDNED